MILEAVYEKLTSNEKFPEEAVAIQRCDFIKTVTLSDLEVLIDIIDEIGGVDIDLTSAEASVLGLSSSVNHLDGYRAMLYVRIRKID